MGWLRRLIGGKRASVAADATLAVTAAPSAPKRPGMVIKESLVTALKEKTPGTVSSAFVFAPYRPMAGVVPAGADTLAMDETISGLPVSWAQQGFEAMASEGLTFMGYPYLSELAQRSEYRVISETIAKEMTRRWIVLKASSQDESKQDKIGEITKELQRLKAREMFRLAAEKDGFFGRSHLFIDYGDDPDGTELGTSIGDGQNNASIGKVANRKIKKLRLIEPMWAYPAEFGASDPLLDTWYNPAAWFVMGRRIHATRLLTFIGRQVPDLLKPAYAFGGLSLSQMAKPYVDNWLRTRQSVSDLVRNFSTSVLKTNMNDVLTGGSDASVLARAALFAANRDNQGVMLLDKDVEDFVNVSAPLSGLHELQAQAQEHMCVQKGTLIETQRGQIAIENLLTDDYVVTRNGLAPIEWAGVTGMTTSFVEINTGDCILRATECHPIWSEMKRGFVDAKNVSRSHLLLKSPAWGNMGRQSFGGGDIGGKLKMGIIGMGRLGAFSTELCGKLITGPSLLGAKYTTKMVMEAITAGITSLSLAGQNILLGILANMKRQSLSYVNIAGSHFYRQLNPRNIVRGRAKFAPIKWRPDGFLMRYIRLNANIAGIYSHQNTGILDFAQAGACSGLPKLEMVEFLIQNIAKYVKYAGERLLRIVPTKRHVPANAVAVRKAFVKKVDIQPVYNVKVADGYAPEFYANGILVHNCSASRIPLVKLTGISPSGLNASGDAELSVFADEIHASQEAMFGDHIAKLVGLVQLGLYGEVDTDIVAEFVPLEEMNESERATLQKTQADMDVALIDAGVLSPNESRARLAKDPTSPYPGLDTDDEAPDDDAFAEGLKAVFATGPDEPADDDAAFAAGIKEALHGEESDENG